MVMVSYRSDHGGGHFRLRVVVLPSFRRRYRLPPKIDKPRHHDDRGDYRGEQAEYHPHAHRGQPQGLR